MRILTISRDVIAVSAQQRDNEKGVRCIRRRSGSAAGQFLNSVVVFFLAVCSCSLLIPLVLNRFNVVVVNGSDNIEMWTIGPANYTKRAIRPSDWNPKRLSYRTSVASEDTSDSIEVIEAAAELTVQWCNFFSVTMVGSRATRFAVEALEIRLPSPRKVLEVRQLADFFHGLPTVFNCQLF